MLVSKTIEIDAGHRVPNHKSKCSNPHGHRYKIEVGVDDKIITTIGSSDEGMVIDFGDLKRMMMDYLDYHFDHSFICYDKDEFAPQFQLMKDKKKKVVFVDFIPTAENLAKHWYEIMDLVLRKERIKIKYVKVWETPSSMAIYE